MDASLGVVFKNGDESIGFNHCSVMSVCISLEFAKVDFGGKGNLKRNIITTARLPLSLHGEKYFAPFGMSVYDYLSSNYSRGLDWSSNNSLIDKTDSTLALDWPVTALETIE